MMVEGEDVALTTSRSGWRSSIGTSHNCIVIVFVVGVLLFGSLISVWDKTIQKQQQQTGAHHLFPKTLSSTKNDNLRSTSNKTRVGDTINFVTASSSTSGGNNSLPHTGNNKKREETSIDNTTIFALNDIYKKLSNIEKTLLGQKKLTVDNRKKSGSKKDSNATTGTTIILDNLDNDDSNGETMKQEQIEQLQYGCYEHQYTNGSWIKKDTSIPVSNSYFWKVNNDENDNTNKCILEEFSIPKFCKKLNGRSILFVGDSITGQYVEAMEELFTAQNKTAIQYIPKLTVDYRVVIGQQSSILCSQYNKNSSSSYLTYVRNDFLLPTPFAGVDRGNILSPWIHLLSSDSILVLNTGAHARALDQYKTNLKNVKQTIIDSNYTGHVFFRTTPRGHINCSNTINTTPIVVNPKKSLESNKEYSQFFVKFPSHRISETYKNSYHYSDFPMYNEMVKSIMSSSSSTTTATTRPTSLLSMLSFSSATGNSSKGLLSLSSNSTLGNKKNNNNNNNIKWNVIDVAPLLELRPDVKRCYRDDWLHIDMNKQIVLQIFWKLLYNGLQGYI